MPVAPAGGRPPSDYRSSGDYFTPGGKITHPRGAPGRDRLVWVPVIVVLRVMVRSVLRPAQGHETRSHPE